jgi:hypothetical protein
MYTTSMSRVMLLLSRAAVITTALVAYDARRFVLMATLMPWLSIGRLILQCAGLLCRFKR